MANRVIRGRGIVRGPRRETVWAGLEVSNVGVAANAKVLIATLNAAALALRPFTAVRTRLQLLWSSDQIATSENPFGGFGMIVVSDTASALGITAIPSPTGNPSGNWFVWEGLNTKLIVGTNVGFIEPAGQLVTVDSKAMRKVGDDEDIAVVVDNAHGTHGAQIQLIGRVLLKLH